MSKPFPPDWKEVPLGDVAEIQKGTAFTSKELVPGDIPVIAGGREPAYYHKYSNRPPNTITVSGSGAYAGFVSFHDIPIFATDCTTIRSSSSVLTTRYIYYYLKSRQEDIYRRRNGSAQPHVYPRDLATFNISIPSLQEQICIVDILDSVDEAIEHSQNAIIETAQLRDALLHELLDPESNTHTHTHTHYWRESKLGDIAEIEFSSVNKKAVDGELPVLLCNYQDVVGNYRIRSDIDFMSATATPKEVDKWTLRQGDVVFTKDAEIGKVSLIDENIPNLVCGYHLGIARPKIDYVTGPFLAELLKISTVQRQFLRLQTGLTIYGIRLGDTKNLKVLLPPLNEQKRIATILSSVDEVIKQTENIIINTERLHDALLQELVVDNYVSS